jgi:predicted SpoU family rRNA methylase
MRIDDWRFVLQPEARPARLSFGQALAVFQANGMSLEGESGDVVVQGVGESVVLSIGGTPALVKSRADWRKSLDEWRPAAVVPDKG